MKRYQAQAGTSLIELLSTLSIVAILSMLATPSVMALMNNSSVVSTQQLLLQDIRLLRSESAMRHTQSYLCALDEKGKCARRANWNRGWMGFADNNQSKHFDAGDDIIVKYHNLPAVGIDIILHTRWKNLKFNTLGVLRSSGHFRLCDKRNSVKRNIKLVRMNMQGRAYLDESKLECR